MNANTTPHTEHVRETIERVHTRPADARGPAFVIREHETIERRITRSVTREPNSIEQAPEQVPEQVQGHDHDPRSSEPSGPPSWSAMLAIMRCALNDQQRAEFDRQCEARRAERDQAIARAGARGWAAGRSALGRDMAAYKAAKKAGQPKPEPTPPPSFVLLGRAVVERDQAATATPPSSATLEIASSAPTETETHSSETSQPMADHAEQPDHEPHAEQPHAEQPHAEQHEQGQERTARARARLQPTRRRWDGSLRLGRVSVPGTTRERCIVQLPIDDARDRSGNSLVYGFGLRSLMAIGAATRRTALASIVAGAVNPHDPIDVFRWGLVRRLPAGGHPRGAELLALVDSFAVGARATRARVSEFGVNIGADQIRERGPAPSSCSRTDSSAASWRAIEGAIAALGQLDGCDRAELAGLLASGDLDVAIAWAREHSTREHSTE